MINYDLQISVGGYLSATLESIVSAVSPIVGAYPGYTYQRTEITGDVIHIFFADSNASASNVKAELFGIDDVLITAIVYALIVLGVVIITYLLVVVAPKSVAGNLLIIGLGVAAVAYLVLAVKKKGD